VIETKSVQFARRRDDRRAPLSFVHRYSSGGGAFRIRKSGL
jgi:hypothetical protein